MIARVKLTESNPKITVTFSEKKQSFKAAFKDFILVEKTDIPKEYGLITYTQDRIITVT